MQEPHDEATARAINAEPWEPLPGMVKRQCPDCRYFFAAPPGVEEQPCPERESRAWARKARGQRLSGTGRAAR